MAWTTPRTWSIAEVLTAALMNTHVRDNLNYLKGSPTFDGSITVAVSVTAGVTVAAGDYVVAQSGNLAQVVIGDFGPASQAAIAFGSGVDTVLYRSAADWFALGSGDSLDVSKTLVVNSSDSTPSGAGGSIFFGSAWDTELHRESANVLRTNDSFYVGGQLSFANGSAVVGAGYIAKASGDNAIECFGGAFVAGNALRIPSKAGIPVDGDFTSYGGLGSPGHIVVDVTNSRLYVRTASGTWKYAALT
jgi:hypothetical protein